MEDQLYIIWDDKFKVSVAIIDEQHRGIVTAINSLHHFIREGHGEEALQPTLTILEQYIHIHFKTEERLMEEAVYPAINEHILMHKELSGKTNKLLRDSISDNDTDSVLKFLRTWWMNHINIEDRKYSPYVSRLVRGK